jgi:hypothetical protein
MTFVNPIRLKLTTCVRNRLNYRRAHRWQASGRLVSITDCRPRGLPQATRIAQDPNGISKEPLKSALLQEPTAGILSRGPKRNAFSYVRQFHFELQAGYI